MGLEVYSVISDLQKRKPNKGHWFKIMEEEKETYDIQLSNPEISKMSRGKFGKKVKKNIKTSAVQHLKSTRLICYCVTAN